MDLSILSTIPGLGAIVPYVTGLIAACAAFAAAVPAPTAQAPAWWAKTYSIINLIGINFGHAKNIGAQ